MDEKFIREVTKEETKEEPSIDMRELMVKLDNLTEAVHTHTRLTDDTATALNDMANSMQAMTRIMSGVMDAVSIQTFRDGDNLMAILLREALKK